MTPEIRTLPDDEKISEPGFYAIPLARHHAQPCDGMSVTSGVLRTLELHSPAEVWAFHPSNPNRYTRNPSPALILGQAMAAFCEGGIECLQANFATLPEDVPTRPTKAQIKAIEEGRGTPAGLNSYEFWSAFEADPRPKLTLAQTAEIIEMGRVLSMDRAALATMRGHLEITMAWRDEETGLWCLARPDVIHLRKGHVGAADYKRMAAQGRPFDELLVDRRITDHGYDMQLAFAAEGLRVLTGETPKELGIVAQSESPPYHVILRAFDAETISLAEWRNHRSMRTIRTCLASGQWTGPGEQIGVYRMPERLADKLLSEKSADELARGDPGEEYDFIETEKGA